MQDFLMSDSSTLGLRHTCQCDLNHLTATFSIRPDRILCGIAESECPVMGLDRAKP